MSYCSTRQWNDVSQGAINLLWHDVAEELWSLLCRLPDRVVFAHAHRTAWYARPPPPPPFLSPRPPLVLALDPTCANPRHCMRLSRAAVQDCTVLNPCPTEALAGPVNAPGPSLPMCGCHMRVLVL